MKNEILEILNRSRHIIFLAMLFMMTTILSQVFLYRFIDIHSILLPGGMFIYPLLYVVTDIVTEVYGYSMARLFIWYGFCCSFLFAILALIFINLPTLPSTVLAQEYTAIFHGLLRSVFGGFIAQLTGSFINIYLLSKWKIILSGRHFFIRSFFSNIFGEFISLVIGGCLLFIGKLSLQQAIILLLADYAVRIIFSLLASIPASIFVSYVKKKEHIDIYDKNTQFNPFKLTISVSSPITHTILN